MGRKKAALRFFFTIFAAEAGKRQKRPTGFKAGRPKALGIRPIRPTMPNMPKRNRLWAY